MEAQRTDAHTRARRDARRAVERVGEACVHNVLINNGRSALHTRCGYARPGRGGQLSDVVHIYVGTEGYLADSMLRT